MTAPSVSVVRVPEVQRPDRSQTAHEIATASVAAQARALIEARYVMALQRPRNIDVARVRILEACKRPRFAEAARYIKPIGKGIEGPSIRLAEEAARCMGNIAVDILTIFDDEYRRVVRVSATDLETNLPYSKDVTVEKTVERNSVKEGQQAVGQRIGSRGQKVYVVLATDDEILNKENALTSKALRANLLRLVPADLLEEAMDQVYATLRDKTAKDPSAERKRLIDGFALIGIMPDKVEEYLGHDLGVTTPAELMDLRGVFTALRDGEASWSEVMDNRRKELAAEEEAKRQPEAGGSAPAGGAASRGSAAAATPTPAGTLAPTAQPKGHANLTDVAAQNRARREGRAPATGNTPPPTTDAGPPPISASVDDDEDRRGDDPELDGQPGHPPAPEPEPQLQPQPAPAPSRRGRGW